ncbi:MAG TPA: hypothetical protein HA282_05005 [Nanoarchaeota archaeon]|nr:hypothetical protein [Candidatus Pacearchaeota archaeon]HIH66540.1 hypothetical protein [Nanoarchaeota archaeon]
MRKESLLFLALILASTLIVFPVIYGDTLDTILTIGNTPPYILRANMNIFINTGDSAITLTENSQVIVKCNASLITDANGWQDINKLNGTIYHVSSNHQAADDNNTHYTNQTCSLETGSGTQRGGECIFRVQYYANNQTWSCNLTAWDAGVTGSSANLTNATYANFTVNDLTALNVPADINFGTINVGDTSLINKTNVTNTGNTILDISIYGYGNGINASDNAMNCTLGTNKNISLYYLRYNVTAGRHRDCNSNDFSWTANYWNLTNYTNAKNWTQFTLPPRTGDADGGVAANYTCWILRVPSTTDGLGAADIGGVCRGVIAISAFVNE